MKTIQEKFKKIEEEILDIKNKDYFGDYLFEARKFISDIQYAETHISRTRVSKKFNFQILPSFEGTIMDWFIKGLFFNNNSWRFKEDEVVLRFKIYDITSAIFDKINVQDKNGWHIDREFVKKAIEWSEVLEYYTDKKMVDIIGSFNGSNYGITEIRKVFEELQPNLLTPPKG